jgi:anti-anti-sigma factor
MFSPDCLEETNQPLTLDLSGMQYLSAAGIGELVRIHNRLRTTGGQLILENVSDLVFEILEVAGLTELFNVQKACDFVTVS